MDKNKFTIMIGADVNKKKSLLIGPQFCGVHVGDVVTVDSGHKHTILFAEEYCDLEGTLATGLIVAMGMEPMKIRKKIIEESVNWGDYKEEEEGEEDDVPVVDG